jgi:hypothetical protein
VHVVDRCRRIIASLDGRPAVPAGSERDDWMLDVIKPAHEMMKQSADALQTAVHPHNRGEFVSVSAGLSFGGGRPVRPAFIIMRVPAHIHAAAWSSGEPWYAGGCCP